MVRRVFIVLAVIFTFASCDGNGEEEKMVKYYFEINGIRICVGEDAESVTRTLGKPNRVSRADSCAGMGEDVIYVYDGFRILAYSDGGEAVITSIELTNDAVSTPEGIRIGDGADFIIRMYGVPNRREKSLIEYESGGVRLRFALSDGAVRSVKYLLREE
jgi:hypothetical protein